MKEHGRLYRWFWYRPLFTRLRPRIMTMILALVLPVCLICIIFSGISAYQSSRITYDMGNNGLAMYAIEVTLNAEIDGVDLTENFPSVFAEKVSGLLPTADAADGRVYVSLDGDQSYQVLSMEGETILAEESFDTLRSKNHHYFWQEEDGEGDLRILVTFPYNFALRSIPAWFWISMGIALLTLVLSPFLYRRLKQDILDPMEVLQKATHQFGEDTSYRIPAQPERVAEDFLSLYAGFNDMAGEVQASYQKDVRMLETEMENLRLQINPHMLLNSYNTIYALAQSKNYEVIQDYALCLADYFRYVLRKGDQLSTVKQELEFVDNFIRIQRIRFPGRFSYVYQAEDECLEARIPPLLIENFVENAVKYALNPKEAIEIVVTVRKDQNDRGTDILQIAITDTGSGIQPAVLEKLQAGEPYVDENGQKHIGIWNCLRRIELFYGQEGSAHFSSGEGMGTQIFLTVPFRSGESEENLPARSAVHR